MPELFRHRFPAVVRWKAHAGHAKTLRAHGIVTLVVRERHNQHGLPRCERRVECPCPALVHDHGGTLQSRGRQVNINLMRNDNSNGRIGLSNDYDLPVRPFRVGPSSVPVGGYSANTFSASFATNDGLRLYGGAGADVGQYYGGDKKTLRANLNVLALETMLIENSVTHNRITLPGQPAYSTMSSSTKSHAGFPAPGCHVGRSP